MSPREELRYRRSPRASNMTGAQHRLDALVKLIWGENHFTYYRPRVMGIRGEEDILEYVDRILWIRQACEREGHSLYLSVEDDLLRMSNGKLPAAIQRRATYDYRTSPRVRVAELRYGGKHAQPAFLALEDWKRENDLLYANFLAKLGPKDLEHWEQVKASDLEILLRPAVSADETESVRAKFEARFV